MSDVFQLAIHDYQIISDARLSFDDGLTLIVGTSNNGKSSIIRAAEALIYNKVGNSFIKSGSSEAIVGIAIGDHKVVWKKSASEGIYKVDGQVYNKIGRGQLKEVGDTLGITEIDVNGDKVRVNFLKQMEYPFLLDKNPTQLFEFLAMSNDTDKLSSILKTMRQDLRQTESNISVEIGRIDSYTQSITKSEELLNKYANVDSIVDDILSLDTDINKYLKSRQDLNSVIEEKQDLQDRKPRILVLRQALSNLNETWESMSESLIRYDSSKTALESLQKEKATLVEKRNEILSLRDLKSKFDALSSLDLSSLKEKSLAVSSLKSSIDSLKSKEESLSLLSSDIESKKNELSSLNDSLSEFSVCPLCGQPLNKDHAHS